MELIFARLFGGFGVVDRPVGPAVPLVAPVVALGAGCSGGRGERVVQGAAEQFVEPVFPGPVLG
jgi:hypothetical protein